LQGGSGYSDDVPSGDGGGGSGGGSAAQMQWLVSDHLGTPRMIFDQTGSLANMKRHDYLPFGEELFAPTGGRTEPLGYSGGDTVRQQFTSKERDIETGLDYFGARYYASSQGRFTGADLAGPDFQKPQTLNRYQYCLNNPTRYIDRQGLYEEDVHRDLTFALALAAGFNTHSAKVVASANQYTDDNPKTTPMGMTPWGDNMKKRELYHFTTEARRDELWRTFENSGSLQDLGTFFHAQQDSFSHAGFGARWGHASEGHAPDKTYNDPIKADTMAQDTFTRMTKAVTLLVKNGKETISYAAVDWKSVSGMVGAFNRAKATDEKKKIINQIVTEIQRQHYEQDKAKEAAVKKQRGQ
jgi:RHS repeat-associated protein